MKPTPGLINRIIALILLLLVFTGTLGLGAVWMRQGISQTANHSRALEDRIIDIERRLDEVNAEVAVAVNPNVLLQQNHFMHLALSAPQELHVVRVSESAELRLAAKRNREVFSAATASLDERSPNLTFRVVTAALR